MADLRDLQKQQVTAPQAKQPVMTTAHQPSFVPPSVQPTVDKTVREMVEDEIVAAPLLDNTFDQKLVPTNPNVDFRWVNRGVEMNTDNGRISTLMFDKRLTQGFEVARKEDLRNPPMEYARDNGTKFINGDLILMKIDRRRYRGAILYREQQSAKAVQSVSVAARQKASEELGRKPGREKIQMFDPSPKDFEDAGVKGLEDE